MIRGATRYGLPVTLLLAVGVGLGFMLDGDSQDADPFGMAALVCDRELHPGDDAASFVASLDSRETACLREGSHIASGTIRIESSDVTLRSYPGESAGLVGRLWIVDGADRVTVEGLRLDGRNPNGQPSPTVNADEATFRENEITNENSAICFVIGDDRYGVASGTLIERNRIHDCGRLPPTNHDHGIYVAHARATVIRDNWIYDNADRGIQLYPDADGTRIVGNVVDGNGQGLNFSCDERACSQQNVAEDNLFTNPTVSWNVYGHSQGAEPDGSNLLRGNCVWTGNDGHSGNGGVDSDPDFFSESGNVTLEPPYVDRANADYRRTAASRCGYATRDDRLQDSG